MNSRFIEQKEGPPVLTWTDENGVEQVRHGRRVFPLVELIDQRNALLAQKEDIERQLKDLDHEICVRLIQDGKKQEYGTSGLGYSLFSTTRYEFGKPAYTYLEDKGLLASFVPEPKITKTKLDALLKDGAITYTDMAEIDKWMTVEQSPYSLKKVVAKDVPLGGYEA